MNKGLQEADGPFVSLWNINYLLSFFFICFITCCHSLSFIVTCCYSLHHSLLLVTILVVTRCTIHCHSLSLDVAIVCLFINDQNIPTLKCEKVQGKLRYIIQLFFLCRLSLSKCASFFLRNEFFWKYGWFKGTMVYFNFIVSKNKKVFCYKIR